MVKLSSGSTKSTSTFTKKPKWLLVASGKGGTGKTSTSFNLAVFAAHSGLSTCLVDLDTQPSLSEWHAVRSVQEPEAPEIALWSGGIPDVPQAVRDIDSGDFDIVIVDTPPALGHDEVKLLISRSDFVLVPTTQGVVDMKASIAWMAFLDAQKARASFLLNRSQRTFSSFQRAKLRLIKFGSLCPIDVRLLDDVAAAGDIGLGVLEMAKSKAADDYQGVWDFLRAELGIKQ
jgi:chromosome partitioning protein